MAPLVPPPPIINFEEAKKIEERILGEFSKQDGKPKLVRSRSHSLISYFLGTKGATHAFTGKDFVTWCVANKYSPDATHGAKVGQALIEHRLIHHVTDDYDFIDDPNYEYAFISQETIENKMFHSALGQYISRPDVFFQTKLELKSKTFFGYDKWIPCYGVLDDPSSKPRMVHLFKRASAASPPFLSAALEDCLCSLEECLDCKTDWYCFNLKARKIGTMKDVMLTLCADHSKRQEGWIAALMSAGVEFTKEDEGIDLNQVKSIFQLSARKLNSNEIIPLDLYKGKVCLVVNVASKWGLTPRDYTEMVEVYNKYHSRGFEILAFPCNQFGNQEPHDEETIRNFADGYNATFPIFGKIEVNGSNAHPVFKFLKAQLGGLMGSSIKWNFTKFLCDKNGIPVKRYGPPTAPSAISSDIEELLEQ